MNQTRPKLNVAINKLCLCPHRDLKYSPSLLKTVMLETPIQSVTRLMMVGTPASKGREDVTEVDVAQQVAVVCFR